MWGMKGFRTWRTGVLAAVLMAGHVSAQQAASAAAGDASAVFATVNGVQLYRAQLEGIIRNSGLPDNDATRAAVGKDMISGEVVRQAAEKA